MITKLGKLESWDLNPGPLISRTTTRHKPKCFRNQANNTKMLFVEKHGVTLSDTSSRRKLFILLLAEGGF